MGSKARARCTLDGLRGDRQWLDVDGLRLRVTDLLVGLGVFSG